jgi:amino acid transporter
MTPFITPAIDMIIALLAIYAVLYYLYIRIYKKDLKGIYSVDIKVSLTLLLLVIALYYDSGMTMNLVGLEVGWLAFFILISFMIETLFFLLYRRVVGLSWKQVGKKIT